MDTEEFDFDNEEIEAAVQSELQSLGEFPIDSEDLSEDHSASLLLPTNVSDQYLEPKSVADYEKVLTQRRAAFDQQLEDCNELLKLVDRNIADCQGLRTKSICYHGSGKGDNSITSILKEIEDEEEGNMPTSSEQREEGMALSDSIDDIPESLLALEFDSNKQMVAISNTENLSDSLVEEEFLSPEKSKSNVRHLENQAKLQLKELTERQEMFQKLVEQDNLKLNEQKAKMDVMSLQERSLRKDAVKKEEEEIELLKFKREENLQMMIKNHEKTIGQLNQQFEEQMSYLEKQTQSEANRLRLEIFTIQEQRRTKENVAATKIQAFYRAYRVRRVYQKELYAKVNIRLQKIESERIHQANMRIEKMLEEKRKEEEERRKVEAEKKAMEEQKKAIEAEKKAMEEQKRQQKKLKKEMELMQKKKQQEEDAAKQQREKEEAARLTREKEETARLIREKEEAARLTREKEEAARLPREKEEAARLTREKEEAARLMREEEEAAKNKLQFGSEETSRHKETGVDIGQKAASQMENKQQQKQQKACAKGKQEVEEGQVETEQVNGDSKDSRKNKPEIQDVRSSKKKVDEKKLKKQHMKEEINAASITQHSEQEFNIKKEFEGAEIIKKLEDEDTGIESSRVKEAKINKEDEKRIKGKQKEELRKLKQEEKTHAIQPELELEVDKPMAEEQLAKMQKIENHIGIVLSTPLEIQAPVIEGRELGPHKITHSDVHSEMSCSNDTNMNRKGNDSKHKTPRTPRKSHELLNAKSGTDIHMEKQFSESSLGEPILGDEKLIVQHTHDNRSPMLNSSNNLNGHLSTTKSDGGEVNLENKATNGQKTPRHAKQPKDISATTSLTEQNINNYKQWLGERKAFASGVKAPVEFVQVDMSFLNAKLEERRKRWMKECTPWSQTSTTAFNKLLRIPKVANRPLSAVDKQNPLAEDLVLSCGKCKSLVEVECVKLEDLPGCSVSTLSACRRLKALKLARCGVTSVNGLEGCQQLQYAHLTENNISSIALACVTLVHLDLSNNSLNQLKGIEACSNLKYLNLTKNRISRLTNVGFHKRLNTLLIAHNELTNTKGLGDCVAMQVLDLSSNHLTSIQEISNLGLLRSLRATSNNLMEIPQLGNCVLLQELVLDDNSISTLDGLAFSWLPSLLYVNLAQNSISSMQPLHGCCSIKKLDLSSNQLVGVDNVIDGLKFCVNLEELFLHGNPLTALDSNKLKFATILPKLKMLDEHEILPRAIEGTPELEIMKLVHSAEEALALLDKKIGKALESEESTQSNFLNSLSELLHYYDLVYKLAENIRYAHEYGNTTFDSLPSSTVHSAKAQFESRLKSLTNNKADACPEGPKIQGDDAKALFEQRLRDKLASTELKVSEDNMKIIIQSTSPREVKDLSLSNGASTTKIRSSSQQNDIIKPSNQPLSKAILQTAATKIQAVWRGYTLRKKLLYALTFAQKNLETDEEFAEVDLSTFDFKDDTNSWLPSDIPQLPQAHAKLPSFPGQSSKELYEPKQAWRASPTFINLTSSKQSPVPPLSSMSGEITQRTIMSKKEEQIANDWGFKDAHTAELMLKRAKKLKYDSERKKKLSQLDAVQRYEVQKKVLDVISPTKPPNRKVVPRKEYFKAMEEEAKKKQHLNAVNNAKYVERTYEWVHSQLTNSARDGLIHVPHKPDKLSTIGERQLPQLDKRVLEGGRAQLVGSPLDIMSLDSYHVISSAGSRRTEPSPEPHLFFDNESTETRSFNKGRPSGDQTKKAGHKVPSDNLDDFSAWGSGKKRTKR